MSDSEKLSGNENNGNDSSIENPAQSTSQSAEDFKEGGSGWVVIFAVFLLNFHTWGLNSTFAVFLAYYLKTNAFDTTPLGYAFVGGLSISIALLASPLTTFLAGWKRFGTRWTIFLGAVFETIGFIGSSFASQLWHILLSQGVSFGLGMGLCFVASAAVPPQWFTKRRSFANAIAASGSGFGGLCYSLASNAMIARIGLPWTFRVIAIICFVVNGAASFFIRDRNKAIGSVHVPFNWQLFKRPSFLMLEAWMVLSILGYTILVFSIVAYCQEVGLSSSQASLVGAMFNLAQGIGRPVIGLSSDYVGRLNVANFSTLLCGLLCLFFWTFGARSLASCIVFALLSGSVAGAMWATIAPIAAEVVGLAIIPSALAMTWLVLVIPATFAEVIGLSLRQPGSWGYLHAQIFTGFMYIGAFIFGWGLRAWKVWELEQIRLDKEERELAIRDDGVVGTADLERHVSRTPTVRQRVLKLRGLWSVQRV
ncbi:Uu.00g015760.m01.CDS01 [Anthostomella pinea]|uniref:Uu.00g015760.m01.CDS01 n=1 Tax=Anthostomella pinea TaxID=933095 RepID=A0AAI8YN78_9PEZI|nr:Uu.00g015760.m01.CDS01 [Anthostomella pinea]